MRRPIVRRPILTIEDLKDAVAFYRDEPDVVFDLETKGNDRLDPRRNHAFWLSVAGRGRADVIPFGHPIGEQIGTTKEPRVGKDGKTRMFTVPVYGKPPKQLWPADVFDAFEPIFFHDERRLWGHNVKFDLETIAKYYDDEFPLPPYGDTQIAAFLLNENLRVYRLGDCVKREFGFNYDKSVGKEVEKYPFEVAANYSYLDARYTWLLMRQYWPQIEKSSLRGLFDLEMDVLGVLCRMEQAGSPPVDIDALRILDADLDEQLTEIKGKLYRIAGRQWNFNSNPQKQRLFYGKRSEGGQGLKPRKLTKGGAPSCDAEALKHYVGNELVDTFLEYQEVNRISSTYVKSYLGTGERKNRDKSKNNATPFNAETGRIHANFKQHGTVTGRFSCAEPNLQNIPRPDTELGKKIRGLFVAGEGERLIVADWSQIEYRILALYSGDKRLMRAFQDGLDFHQYVASLLLGKSMDDVTAVERTLAKNCNFAVAYGASAERIASMSKVPLRQAEKFVKEHHRMLPGMYRFCDDVIRTCRGRRPPYVQTMLGRRRRLPEINSSRFGIRKAAERQAVNTVIQGSAADLCKFAMVREDALLRPGMTLNLTVHDELVTTVPTDMVEDGLRVVREAMMGKDIAELIAPVPLIADIKVVQRWSEAKG